MAPNQTLFLILCLISSLLATFTSHSGATSNDSNSIKGMFVFGSSLVDNGNNNFLPNLSAKADYLPYGLDFPLGVTGRFTNGKNVIDLIGELLKLPTFIPPFLDPSTKGDKIVHDVDFASGASGILDTGLLGKKVINLNQQIKNFEEVTLRDLEIQLGYKANESLPNYLFVLGAGGNDYTLNYFLKTGLTLQTFTDNLISNYSAQIKKLYDLGGRKFVLMSLNPLGCYPMNLVTNIGSCNETLNEAAELFNANLRTLIDRLKQDQMPLSNLVFVNSYNIIRQIIADPFSKGFREAARACCDVGGGNGSSCKRGGGTCTDRNNHVFFDGVHPTEAVNVVIAQKAFTSQDLQNEVYPININQLARLPTITV